MKEFEAKLTVQPHIFVVQSQYHKLYS